MGAISRALLIVLIVLPAILLAESHRPVLDCRVSWRQVCGDREVDYESVKGAPITPACAAVALRCGEASAVLGRFGEAIDYFMLARAIDGHSALSSTADALLSEVLYRQARPNFTADGSSEMEHLAHDSLNAAWRLGDAAAIATSANALASVLLNVNRNELDLDEYENRLKRVDECYAKALTWAGHAGLPNLEQAVRENWQHMAVDGDQAMAELAEALSRQSLYLARQQDISTLAAMSANNLGSALLFQRHRPYPEVLAAYKEALRDAKRAGDLGIEASVHINLARIVTSRSNRLSSLKQARRLATRLESKAEYASLLIEIAELAAIPVDKTDHVVSRDLIAKPLSFSFDTAHAALREIRGTSLIRLTSRAIGLMGELYWRQGRLHDADKSISYAIAQARLAGADDLLVRWEEQHGRILVALGRRTDALASYRRAAEVLLGGLRADIPLRYLDGRSSFNEVVGPVYRGLADLLLQVARERTQGRERQDLLGEVRDTIEGYKIAEIRDYLHDACIEPRRLPELEESTAVLYPILLDDRIELLLMIGDDALFVEQPDPARCGFERPSQWKAAVDVVYESSKAARTLYRCLIEPLEDKLHAVDTIVFVPDGPLYGLPMAALEADDGTYLVETYALAMVPSLRLVRHRSSTNRSPRTLLAGLGEPGKVVHRLPQRLCESILKEAKAPSENMQACNRPSPTRHHGDEDDASMSHAHSHAASRGRNWCLTPQLRKKLVLEAVPCELDALSHILPHSNKLQDASFTLSNFASELSLTHYQVVHLASHGFFGGPPELNVILTDDHPLHIHRLSEILRPKQLREPVDLVVLSACNTAEGDERWPLGLAGVAVQAGAGSVIGAFWETNDWVSEHFFSKFYGHLTGVEFVSTAKALQATQEELIGKIGVGMWAPFVLIGDWL